MVTDGNSMESNQRKPNHLETASGRPRRPRRELPKFPESPIVIPPERVESAKDLLKQVHELWEQGQHYNSLSVWFDLPKDKREDVINNTLLQEAEPANRSLRSAQYDTEGKPENLILKHYALFSTDAVGKLIHPSKDDPITDSNVLELFNNPGRGDMEFSIKLRSMGLHSQPYYHDEDDFTEPRIEITRNFSLEEARELLVKLIPHISGDIKDKLLSAWGIVSSTKHADLLADPRLADALEKPILGEVEWVTHLENYLEQAVFPSTEFFEEAFERLKPEDSNPNANFQISLNDIRDTEVPASIFYFTMLRRITLLDERRKHNPEFGKGREEKIISYLLNDAFMEHALPYLETDTALEDNFVEEGRRLIVHNAEVEATGDEAKEIKKKRFGEVLGASEAYLTEKGDTETIQKLREREVEGIKFSDYWPKDVE